MEPFETEPVGAATESHEAGNILKIMCWNINCLVPTVRNMELRHGSFRGFLDHFHLDIACFQEVKLPSARIPKELAVVEGFQSFWATSTSKPGYSGVTTWCRTATAAPRDAAVDCLGDPEHPELDVEGRLVLTDHDTFVLLNVYGPNAGDRPERSRLQYKLTFLRALREKVDELTALGRQVIVVGDLNVATEPRDVHPSIEFDSLYDSRELELLLGLVRAYPDVWRRLHPHVEGCYTVWDERTSARTFNVGLRIDYILMSPGLLPYVHSCEILTAAAIPPKWSDHAALLLALHIDGPQALTKPQGPPIPLVPPQLVLLQLPQPGPLSPQPQPSSQSTEENARSLEVRPRSPRAVAAVEAAEVTDSNISHGTQAPDSGQGVGDGAGRMSLVVPRLALPLPPAAPCALWRELEARFVDRNQKSIRDMFGRRQAATAMVTVPLRRGDMTAASQGGGVGSGDGDVRTGADNRCWKRPAEDEPLKSHLSSSPPQPQLATRRRITGWLASEGTAATAIASAGMPPPGGIAVGAAKPAIARVTHRPGNVPKADTGRSCARGSSGGDNSCTADVKPSHPAAAHTDNVSSADVQQQQQWQGDRKRQEVGRVEELERGEDKVVRSWEGCEEEEEKRVAEGGKLDGRCTAAQGATGIVKGQAVELEGAVSEESGSQRGHGEGSVVEVQQQQQQRPSTGKVGDRQEGAGGRRGGGSGAAAGRRGTAGRVSTAAADAAPSRGKQKNIQSFFKSKSPS